MSFHKSDIIFLYYDVEDILLNVFFVANLKSDKVLSLNFIFRKTI